MFSESELRSGLVYQNGLSLQKTAMGKGGGGILRSVCQESTMSQVDVSWERNELLFLRLQRLIVRKQGTCTCKPVEE